MPSPPRTPRCDVAAGDLSAALRDLDAQGARPVGLVMSPETWATLAGQPEAREPDSGAGYYDGVPVWLRTGCDGVELLDARGAPRPAADDVAWI